MKCTNDLIRWILLLCVSIVVMWFLIDLIWMSRDVSPANDVSVTNQVEQSETFGLEENIESAEPTESIAVTSKINEDVTSTTKPTVESTIKPTSEPTPEPTPEPSESSKSFNSSITVTDVHSNYFPLSDYERRTVECMVMGEAGNQALEGQMAVAQCILNACIKDDLTPSEVRSVYKYSGWSENPSESVKTAVTKVFDNGETVVDEPILWFYNPAISNGTFHNTQTFVISIGDHRFYKEAGT